MTEFIHEGHSTLLRPENPETSIRVMHVLPNLEVGGTQKLTLDLIDHLPEVETSVAGVIMGGDYQPELESRCPTIVLGDEQDDPHRSYMWFRPGPIRRLMEFIEEQRPDVVQTHTFPAAVVGRAAAALSGVPVIIETLHNTYHWKQPKDLRIDRFLARWTDGIVCDSDAVKNYAIEQNPGIPADKFRRIHLGVDTERYHARDNGQETRSRFDLSPDDLVIGAMGRLVGQKRMGDLVEAAPEILSQFPQARFLIVGEGPLADQLTSEVRSLGLDYAFRFVGTIMDNENIYPACDVFAQLAEREGFGLSMVEAMVSRTPLVAANAPPVQEIVRHDHTGIVYDVGDIDALANNICTLLDDPAKREALGANAEEDVHQRFTISRTARNYRAVYDEFLAKKHA
jgi:glycosyltransferase involved in cell wall biosynthesis